MFVIVILNSNKHARSVLCFSFESDILKLLQRVADVAKSLYGFWFIVINRVDCVTER